MEIVERMTPEGPERYLLLDGVVLRLDEVREILSLLRFQSQSHRLCSENSAATASQSEDRIPSELRSNILQLVPACCALHAKRKSQ